MGILFYSSLSLTHWWQNCPDTNGDCAASGL